MESDVSIETSSMIHVEVLPIGHVPRSIHSPPSAPSTPSTRSRPSLTSPGTPAASTSSSSSEAPLPAPGRTSSPTAKPSPSSESATALPPQISTPSWINSIPPVEPTLSPTSNSAVPSAPPILRCAGLEEQTNS
ncbi:putative protein TPRXL [Rosa chinensis]|uniref:putative protein TPRXL n=1 Tax=Rosa chinensis TaxID=74649 RepID=UPI000D094A91|nr:putative protein TPRXL [Rosa chinensis]